MKKEVRRWRVLVSCLSVVSLSLPSVTLSQESEVSPDDVKRFLDPTMLINSIDYTFEAAFLPHDVESYNHTVMPVWALSYWTAVWAEIPYRRFSVPERSSSSGVGDVILAWGAIFHEDLERRFTSSLAILEVHVPTGSSEKGTGVGRWVIAPSGAIALNPTDLFPIYVEGQYKHSIGGDGGEPVRSIEFNVATVRILPKGFYVSAVPVFFFDLHRDTRSLSASLVVGRALTRNFAWSAGYANHVAGTKRFNQGLSLGLSFIWGEQMVRGR